MSNTWRAVVNLWFLFAARRRIPSSPQHPSPPTPGDDNIHYHHRDGFITRGAINVHDAYRGRIRSWFLPKDRIFTSNCLCNNTAVLHEYKEAWAHKCEVRNCRTLCRRIHFGVIGNTFFHQCCGSENNAFHHCGHVNNPECKWSVSSSFLTSAIEIFHCSRHSSHCTSHCILFTLRF